MLQNIEKYNNSREALSNGDKILSENYFQHADHFTRILSEQEIFKKSRSSDNGLQSSEKTDLKNNEKSQETVQDDNEKFDKVQS